MSEKVLYRSYNSTFLNSDAVFVEYEDVLKSPAFTFLFYARESKVLKDFYNLDEVEGLSVPELYEWYMHRKYQNILHCLKPTEKLIDICKNDKDTINSFSDKFLSSNINANKYFIDADTKLNFYNSLKILISSKDLVKRFFIYSPFQSDFIKEEIQREFDDRISYVYGDLKEVLLANKITNNSTFIFSDIRKIEVLYDTNLLNLSSIMIADGYDYNMKNKYEAVIDIPELQKHAVFKLNFFNNIYM